MLTLYLGVDFHPQQQTVCWCDPHTGEIKTQNLFHNSPALQQFYQMPVGIEASTQAVYSFQEKEIHREEQHEGRKENPMNSRFPSSCSSCSSFLRGFIFLRSIV